MSVLKKIVDRSRRLGRLAPSFRADDYWEKRYASGDHSGAGTEGFNYEFKRDTVRRVLDARGIRSAVDFGCGDGRQLLEILRGGALEEYLGLEVAPSAVERCRGLYRDCPGCRFALHDEAELGRFDLALSLDVLYHIVDADTYVSYLRRLFGCSTWVLIYANLEVRPSEVPHMLFRDNLAEIDALGLSTELIEVERHPKKSTGFALYRNSPAS